MWCDTFKNKENIQLRLDFWQSYILCTETGSPPAAPPPSQKKWHPKSEKKTWQKQSPALVFIRSLLKVQISSKNFM